MLLRCVALRAEAGGVQGRALAAQVATARACPHAHVGVPLGTHFPRFRLRTVLCIGLSYVHAVLFRGCLSSLFNCVRKWFQAYIVFAGRCGVCGNEGAVLWRYGRCGDGGALLLGRPLPA